MNVINKIRGCLSVFLLLAVMLLSVGNATANSVFVSPGGENVSTKLDNVSHSLRSTYGWLLGGEKVNPDGRGEPCVGLVPFDGAPAQYWLLDEGYVYQLFEKEDEYYVLLSNGKTFLVDRTELSLADIELKPKSLLVATAPELIACTRLGFLTKANPEKMSNCYRVDGSWNQDVYWTQTNVLPEMCDGELKVLVGANHLRKWEVVSLDPQTGEIRSAQKVNKPEAGESVCELKVLGDGPSWFYPEL